MTDQPGALPLRGIRVLDLGQILAAPFCGMILADLGAEVIKVEPPRRGDESRHFGPYVDGTSTYFRLFNRNKLGITLDLKQPDDLARLRGLVERSDVLVENLRPGALDRLGIGAPALLAINPRLVVASISGFGRTGPLSARPAYDILVQGMSGLMAATGPVGGGPTRSAASLGDLVPGLYAALGIVSALVQRATTGLGQHVDIAMLDSLLSILESVGMRAIHTSQPIVPLGNDHALSAPFGTFATADEPIVIAIASDPTFERFALTLGHPEWPSDPRFATDTLRAEHRDELRVEIEEALEMLSRDAALALLESSAIPAGPLLGVREALSQPQSVARRMVVAEEDGFLTIGSPLKLGAVGTGAPRPAPRLGEHNGLLDGWLAELPRTGG
jgi:CoA:oxalate CoA-transferase